MRASQQGAREFREPVHYGVGHSPGQVPTNTKSREAVPSGTLGVRGPYFMSQSVRSEGRQWNSPIGSWPRSLRQAVTNF